MKNKKVILIMIALIAGILFNLPANAQNNFVKTAKAEAKKFLNGGILDDITLGYRLVEASKSLDFEIFDPIYNELTTNNLKNEIALNALTELINSPEGTDGFIYLFYNIRTRGGIEILPKEKVYLLEQAIILHPSNTDLFLEIFNSLKREDIIRYFEASVLLEYSVKEDMAFNTTNLLNLVDSIDNLKATIGKNRVPLLAYWAYSYSDKSDKTDYLDYVKFLIDYGASLDTEVKDGKTVRDFINQSSIEEVKNLLK